MPNNNLDIKELLDKESARINNPAFIVNDPVQFPRKFTKLEDIEIVSLLSATIAWGNRKMICANCERLLTIMGNEPAEYVKSRAYEDLADQNIHRTFFAKNLRHFLRGLNFIYNRYGSIADFARKHNINDDLFPSWKLVELMNNAFKEANNGQSDSRCFPLNLKSTALKRVNMALRWLVRDDGIVDIGVWNRVIDKANLFIPLDVHVGNTARKLGLISRNANDRKSAVELTMTLRKFCPEDPVKYDFALFGLCIEKSQTRQNSKGDTSTIS